MSTLSRCAEGVLHNSAYDNLTPAETEHEIEMWDHMDGSFTTLYCAQMGGRIRRSPGRITAFRDDTEGSNFAWIIDKADPVIWLRPHFMALLRRRTMFPMMNGGVRTYCKEGRELLRFHFGGQRFIYAVEGIIGDMGCDDTEPCSHAEHGPVWQARWPD